MNEKKSITNIPLPVLSLSRTLRRKEEKPNSCQSCPIANQRRRSQNKL